MIEPTAIDPSGTVPETPVNAGRTALGKDDFLRLLVTQLQQQDPLNPLESTEFTAQLAQFSSLEQLQGVRDGIEQLLNAQAGETSAGSVAYIGKTVQLEDDTVAIRNGTPGGIAIELSAPASDVWMLVRNTHGDLVRSMNLGPQDGGSHIVPWDGTDQWSQPLGDGNYALEAVAQNGNGEAVPATPLITDTITGITFKNGIAHFVAGGREVPQGAIRAVSGP